jgi:hypothetical protein
VKNRLTGWNGGTTKCYAHARDGIAAAAIYRAMCILGKGGEREWDWRFGADEHVREKRMIYGAYGK